MKRKVNALWLNSKREDVVNVDCFSSLTRKFQNIGFVLHGHSNCRFMIVTSGPAEGFAVAADGTWTEQENQEDSDGTYYVFDTARELYEWLAEGEY